MIKGGFIIDNKDVKDRIAKAKQGDEAIMGEIVLQFTPFVVKSAKSIYIRGYEISDLIQSGKQSIIKAVKMYDMDKRNNFIGYVISAIKKNFYVLIRNNVKKSSYISLNILNEEGSELIDMLVSEENIEEDFLKRQERIKLKEALSKLSDKEKEIIYWYYFENRSLREYAELKAIGYRTALDRKSRALIKLRTFMEGNYNGNI